MKNQIPLIKVFLFKVFLSVAILFIISAKPTCAQDQDGYTVDYYYKIKWGYFDEFLELYKKNHYPILAEMKRQGEILDLAAVYPLNHVGESDRWDFRFTIVFKDFDAAHNSDISKEIEEKLYPDRGKFKNEEQRRFEIIVEHMDVPLTIENLSDW